jgi:MoxR-like ATPase
VSLTAQPAYFDLTSLRQQAKAEVARVVVGQEEAIDLLLVAALAHGHVLLEGPPGSAKTLLGRAMAYVFGAEFRRMQFTPDTTPKEITGHYEKRSGELVFVKGIVFANVLLADEINRTPPRTQAALLEAMQERTVTVDGQTHRLPDPFLVIATQNPYEHEGIHVLPESQLDRFLFKIDLDYCDAESEVEMLRLPHTGVTPDMLGEIRPLLGIVGLDKARGELDTTEVPEDVARYIVRLVRCTREIEGVELGASSRAAIHLLSAAKANARLEGRDTVTIHDVRVMTPSVLRHRLICKNGATTPDEALRKTLALVSET